MVWTLLRIFRLELANLCGRFVVQYYKINFASQRVGRKKSIQAIIPKKIVILV